MITDRERFLFMLATQHALPGDAIVVLCGQDGQDRLQAGVHAFGQSSRWVKEVGGNPEVIQLVLSGGVSGRGVWSAKDLESIAWGYGVSPSRISLETESENTHEQSVLVAKIAADKGWKRVILIASPYHVPRAYLTFLKAFNAAGIDKECQIIARPATHLKWTAKPDGVERTRSELFLGEMGKCALYSDHVSTFAEGIASLEYWEAR